MALVCSLALRSGEQKQKQTQEIEKISVYFKHALMTTEVPPPTD
jgi:hypothetical protein